jgi:hypothetical protein
VCSLPIRVSNAICGESGPKSPNYRVNGLNADFGRLKLGAQEESWAICRVNGPMADFWPAWQPNVKHALFYRVSASHLKNSAQEETLHQSESCYLDDIIESTKTTKTEKIVAIVQTSQFDGCKWDDVTVSVIIEHDIMLMIVRLLRFHLTLQSRTA